jgi:3-oxoacyl-[acyl-carrier protein] reductase
MHEPDHEGLKGCAVITGANRGIGKATAVVFAQNGFNLILTCRDKTQDFAQWCDQLAVDYKINVTVEVVNLKDLESIKDLIRRIAKNSSAPNVLVNNAGTAHGALVQLTPSKQILEMITKTDSKT